ncbi:MAG: hypothetical protein GYB33_15080 [Gammaproteobacteria bacterium]|nr:hypothetical protein [Gammaproteobacteria bacterium]
MAKLAVEIAIGLIGLLALWSGLFRIAEQAGLVQRLSQLLAPFFSRVMPEVPRGHAAQGAITMNLAANMLGLDNAATPLGLKAMQALQSLNPHRDTASNAQILFLVLNTSSVTLLPVTIFMYRAQLGAADPTDVFIPILLATTASTLVGLITVLLIQRIRLDGVVLAYLGGILLFVGGLVYWLTLLPSSSLTQVSQNLANGLLLLIIAAFVAVGLYRRVPGFEGVFNSGQRGVVNPGQVISYPGGVAGGIGVFCASGALDYLLQLVTVVFAGLGIGTGFVDALPVAFMKPFSGSGARAMMVDTMNTFGVDSLVGRLAAVMQGSTETTLYVLTLYFGVVGITRMRYALWCGLLCDGVGIVTSITLGMWFFG